MKVMTSKEIKDHYGDFTEVARRETVVHTSHGRPTLVTISIDRAKQIPELRHDLNQPETTDRQVRLARLLSLGGIGEALAGKISASELKARSQAFRGNDAK
jgi:hypothetical protein